MRRRKTTDIFSWLIYSIRSDTIKRYLSVLILVALTGTLGLIPSLHELETPWLATLSFTSQQHYPDSITQGKYLPSNEDEFIIKGFKNLFELFSTENFESLTSPINSYWEIFLDTEKSSPYISFFGSFPLRSPPYFS